MKLLIAEDDAFFRRLLQQVLAQTYELVVAEDGIRAWEVLQHPGGPQLAILDWVMPGLSGPQVCRKVRETSSLARRCYLVILTARNSPADILSGLRAGADDYVTKPFDPEELRSRVRLGARLIELQDTVAAQASALEEARGRERELQALLPVCPRCRHVRADGAFWSDLEHYLDEHGRDQPAPTHCPICAGLLNTGAPRELPFPRVIQ
jgi:sigma-B regulation protein RsbU (phosphoserine phosphatase)